MADTTELQRTLLDQFGRSHASKMALEDKVEIVAGLLIPVPDHAGIIGRVLVEKFDEDGKLVYVSAGFNLVTQVGDQYYGERAAGISSPPGQVTGMRLGTGGATAAAKTGAGAAIVTYVTASQHALDATYPTSSLSGSSRRITWKTTWAAGEGTSATAINEAVITNEASISNVAGTAANTIARVGSAGFSNAVPKGALDTLVITWTHDLLGA